MRRNTNKQPVTRTMFLEEQGDDDFVGFFEKDKRKATRRENKQAAQKRRQALKERRYEEDWN